MSTHHVRAALLEAQEALAHLLSDEVMLERINAAGNLMADALESLRCDALCRRDDGTLP